MDAPTLTGLSGWMLVLVGALSLAFYAAQWYFKRKNIVLPAAAADWIKALGGQILVDAYIEAEAEAKEPDAKRDIAAAIIQASAERYLGLVIPTDILNLMIEFIVNLIQHEGEDAVIKFIENFPGGTTIPTETV